MIHIDNEGQIHEDVFTFREEAPKEERKEDTVEKRIMCKMEECNSYKFFTEQSLEVHKYLYHEDQPFDREQRPIEHRCVQEGKQLRCN